MKNTTTFLVTITLSLLSTLLFAQTDFKPYHLKKTLLANNSNGWDYLTIDANKRNLFVSNGIQVLVYNIDRDTLLAVISKTKGVHGVAINTDLNKGYTSNGKSNSISIFSENNFTVYDTMALPGNNPDAILYDSYSKRLFVFNGRSKNVVIIDPVSLAVDTVIALGGKPEFAVSNNRGSVFVNLEDDNRIVTLKSKAEQIENTWSISPGSSPSGLAIDTINHLLFSVCENHLLVVSNYITHQVITTLSIDEAPDAVVFDQTTGLLYSSNGEGTIQIFKQSNAASYELLQNLKTQKACRTMALDPYTKKIYTASCLFDEGKKRIPNTFRIIVFEH